MNLKIKAWTNLASFQSCSFKSEDVCLYTDAQGLSFAFLVGEEGLGEQWLVAQHEKALVEPQLVRRLKFSTCQQCMQSE